MALAKYDAYAGKAEMPNGVTVDVRYLDAAGVRAEFGAQLPPGHPNRKQRIGWYWESEVDNRRTLAGPFTSSRKAMQDAITSNPEVRHEAA
jgi:hypothetical protein